MLPGFGQGESMGIIADQGIVFHGVLCIPRTHSEFVTAVGFPSLPFETALGNGQGATQDGALQIATPRRFGKEGLADILDKLVVGGGKQLRYYSCQSLRGRGIEAAL